MPIHKFLPKPGESAIRCPIDTGPNNPPPDSRTYGTSSGLADSWGIPLTPASVTQRAGVFLCLRGVSKKFEPINKTLPELGRGFRA